jgi:hypothetical protein
VVTDTILPIGNRLTADLAMALDPVRLAYRVGMDPDDWQARLLRSTARQTILNCCRQSGKSSTTALLALHEALYRGPSLTLCVSPSQRQSIELLAKIRAAHAALGGRIAEESVLRLSLPNGSRIIALPGKEATVRGYSGVSLLLVDEASRVPDDLYQAVRPMVAVSGGRLVLLSTPFGRRGFFFQEWENGTDWERVQITADQCPRIPKDWLAAERLAIGPWWASQEWDCQFVETLDQVFAYSDVMAALSPTVQPLFGAAA